MDCDEGTHLPAHSLTHLGNQPTHTSTHPPGPEASWPRVSERCVACASRAHHEPKHMSTLMVTATEGSKPTFKQHFNLSTTVPSP